MREGSSANINVLWRSIGVGRCTQKLQNWLPPHPPGRSTSRYLNITCNTACPNLTLPSPQSDMTQA